MSYTPPPPPPGNDPPAGGGGYPPPPGGGGGYAEPQTNKKALWAMILGILSPLCCGIITGIPALILGSIGKKEVAAAGAPRRVRAWRWPASSWASSRSCSR